MHIASTSEFALITFRLRIPLQCHQSHSRFSDLFNLPLPALWSVVLGENNRKVESGYEQRIPVDKIIMHEKYRHFKNDLGM